MPSQIISFFHNDNQNTVAKLQSKAQSMATIKPMTATTMKTTETEATLKLQAFVRGCQTRARVSDMIQQLIQDMLSIQQRQQQQQKNGTKDIVEEVVVEEEEIEEDDDECIEEEIMEEDEEEIMEEEIIQQDDEEEASLTCTSEAALPTDDSSTKEIPTAKESLRDRMKRFQKAEQASTTTTRTTTSPQHSSTKAPRFPVVPSYASQRSFKKETPTIETTLPKVISGGTTDSHSPTGSVRDRTQAFWTAASKIDVKTSSRQLQSSSTLLKQPITTTKQKEQQQQSPKRDAQPSFTRNLQLQRQENSARQLSQALLTASNRSISTYQLPSLEVLLLVVSSGMLITGNGCGGCSS